eukprot:gene3899-4443_t
MLFHCGGCKCVSYCGKRCQVSAWNQHKTLCIAIQKVSTKRIESDVGPSLVDADNSDVYATYITPREKAKVAKLIGNKCIIFCRLNGVETPVLLDTGAQVSIISLQQVKSQLKGTTVNKIEDLLDPGANLELKTANGTTLPYLGWINVKCELKDNSTGTGVIDLPMLVTESNIDNPIIGYNVLEELVGKYDGSLGTDEITLLLKNSLPRKIAGNVNAIINCIQMQNDPYLSAVKTLKRDITIPAQETKKLSFRINSGHVDKDTPVMFENDVFQSLPNGIEIDETLIYLKGGNNVRVNLIVSNTSAHNIVLKGRTVIGTLQLVRSVTPIDVTLKEPTVDSKPESEVKVNTATQEAEPLHLSNVFVPEVVLNDHLTAEQKQKVHEMLMKERGSFCKDDNDIGCANNLQMKMELTDNTPVAKTYLGVPRPLIGELKEYVEDLLNKGFIQRSRSSYSSPCVVVRKKDGTMRLCVDYRQLNSKTITDRHPIPRIQDTLDGFAGQQWFSTLDQGKAYHQGFMHPDSRHLTAFVTPWGLFEWQRIPFGLKNAPSEFQSGILVAKCDMAESFECEDFDNFLSNAISNVDTLRHMEYQKKSGTKKKSKSRRGPKVTVVTLKLYHLPEASEIPNFAVTTHGLVKQHMNQGYGKFHIPFHILRII